MLGTVWRESLERYERFMRERGAGRVLLLELGVGEMTPGIITLPFWSMTAKLPDAHLLSVNISGDSAPLQLGNKAEAIRADLSMLLSAARAGGEQRAVHRAVFHVWALKKKALEPNGLRAVISRLLPRCRAFGQRIGANTTREGKQSVPSGSRNALFAFLGSSQTLASSVADAESCRSIICGLY